MSRANYVDPEATRQVDLGPCRCPAEPSPHERDSADVVQRFGYGERGRIAQATRTAGPEAGHQLIILLGVKRWNLVLPDGAIRPLNAEQVARLDKAMVERFLSDDVLGEAFAEDPLPNASGDPSPDGSPTSDSPIQTTAERLSSTST